MDIMTKKRYDALLASFGSMDAALDQLSEEVLKSLGLREETIMKTLNRLEEFDEGAYKRELAKRELRLISIEDDDYPEALRTIDDPPVFLYCRGDLSILASPCVSLVGARDMSEYGEVAVARLIPDLVAASVVTVSGLAAGIDAEVAKETLRVGGKTVAVLGHGFGMIYPKENARLADQIVHAGGLILSEFPLDAEPGKYTFPARNRIIAGLSLATVVVEAAKDSGSLITAELALEYGREVFSVPGRITDTGHEGCHHLIASGQAKLLSSSEELLSDLGIVASVRAPSASLTFDSPEEKSVYEALTSLPAVLDDITVRVKLDAAKLNAVLTMLELKGIAKKLSGGSWVRN